MRALTLLAGLVALLAPAAVHAKGAPVAAVEVCDATGCRPAALTPGLAGIMPGIWMASADGALHIEASPETPGFRIRLSLDDPHGARFFDARGKAIGPVEIDYAPGIEAVRIREPRSKGHWARVDGATLVTLAGLTDGLTPIRGVANRREPVHFVDRAGRAADRKADGKPLAAGLAVLALMGLGAAVTRRRLH